MNENAFLNLISGRTQGLAAALCRLALALLEPMYQWAVGLRNLGFSLGIRRPKRILSPVISIGNITTGGTGKTPIVALVIQVLQQQGRTPGIVSRGYRSVDGQGNDEKRVLERLCPGVRHEQKASRYEAACKLIETAEVNVVVMDDGFQHRQLHRALDIVLIDATNPFGYDHLLPRGLLREPKKSLQRADIILITRADMVIETAVTTIEQKIRTLAPRLVNRIGRVEFRPTSLINGQGRRLAVADLVDQPVLLFSGIGNPEAFAETCRKAGFRIEATLLYPDHHHYSANDLANIADHAAAKGINHVVTTLKDLVKIPDSTSIYALEIAAVFPNPEHREMLENALMEATKNGVVVSSR